MGVDTISQVNISVDQIGHTSVHEYTGLYSWNSNFGTIFIQCQSGPNTSSVSNRSIGSSTEEIANPFYSSVQESVTADIDYVFRADFFGYLVANGMWVYFRTYAVDVTQTVAISSNTITANSANISAGTFQVNTNASTGTSYLEYRKSGDTTWITAGATIPGLLGYGGQSFSRSLSSLLSLTVYEYRLHVTRNTSNSTDFTSGIKTFTTIASQPDITTVTANGVSATAANLNGSVDPNTISCRVRFGWGLSDGGAASGSWANLTAYQNFSGDGAQAFSQALSGLTNSTPYFFRAFVEYPSPGFGSGLSGSTLSFTTSADPAATAKKARMPRQVDFQGKIGQASSWFFTIDDIDTSNNNRFLNIAVPWVAGDVVYSKDDGVTWTNVASLPTKPGSAGVYKLSLSASEMQAATRYILVQVVDLTVPPVWRDIHAQIDTRYQIGTVDVDCSSFLTNTDAVKYTGVGTGYGLNVAGGSTAEADIQGVLNKHVIAYGKFSVGGASGTLALASSGVFSAVATNFFNNNILVVLTGTGRGQARIITTYTSGTRVVILNRALDVNPAANDFYMILPGADVWNVNPSGDLAAIPGVTGAYGDKIQALFGRFFFKRTEDAISQKVFNSADVLIGTGATVSDSAGLQTIGKYI